ncbi:hypothetical protein KAF25_002241 [Fusarium avenaceum]|uniref:Glycoside hydrolase family 5 domain-containing protein n=1 Tax=Fusarium avenaceum TaxID=40199 RepID=A0A9P7H7E9_9HYPO|nr:hypothetical protein KAF25_002241 [Fusarium avenaceum]
MKQFVGPLLALGCLIGNAAAAWPNGPFKTSGRWIVNANNEKVKLAGANWPGHGEVMVPEGLQYQSIQDVISDIKSIGMNAIRLTYATELVDQIYDNGGKDIDLKTSFEQGLGKENGTIVLAKVLKNNPSFTAKTTRLEVYDAIAAECLRQKVYINLDNHISEAKWCCGGTDSNTWWGDTQFDVDKWVRGGAYMAAHSKKWPAKVSQSLRNEPREPTNNNKLRDESYNWSDLYKYMRQGADAVHKADPNAIIIISGMNYDTYVTPLFTGAKLEPRGEVFNRDDFVGYGKDKLVLEIHTYENKGTSCPSLRHNLYTKGFQAMNETDPNTAEVFPVMLTEFGQAMNGADYETAKTYISCLSQYLPELQASWFIWVIVGRYYTRQGIQEFDDSWGMKKPDWSGWRNDEYINTYLKPQIAGTLKYFQMALFLRDRSPLKPEIRLAQAVSEFEAILTSEQKVSFSASRSSAATAAPSMSDVMRLTAEIDLKATSKHGRGRCFGPRMTNILQSIQQFAALGDVVIGGSQNLIACGVWAAARMTLHVMTGYFTYLERLSLLLMTVGRSAPRYQALAVIYPKSKNLQRYLYEYFITVTKLCHQSVAWAQKSSLQRLSSSISDPDMKNFQSDLEVWSTSIREEANLLLNQKVDEEANQNSSFRNWIANRDGRLHWQERIKSCVAFLDACSQYDYRTPWKQTRKHGTTSVLKSSAQYQQWKRSKSTDRSLIVHGTLGSGKSVLLANIVDDLNLQDNTIVLYLFSRHDDFSSLKSRTILGSLIRQLLESFVNDDSFSHIFVDTISSLDLDDIMSIFRKFPSHPRQVFVVVDGLDECPFEEQQTARRCLTVLQSIGYRLCVSVRTPERTTIWDQRQFQFQLSISENNSDIVDYLQAEVDNRVRDGRLATRDPELVKDIKEELTRGAGGMFLWVTLQLDSICMGMSDHDIREAIGDLPSDLTLTYERNLIKANAKDSKYHHIRVFKLLVSARELLTTDQLREAVSVTIGDTTWDPSREIGDVHAILRFCGSLVMVDEEDDTVRFIHHSARSFCLNSPRNNTEWTFTKKQADENMAGTLVTYLSYNTFETRLSRNRVPNVDVNEIPKKVALTALSKRDIGASFALKLLKPRSQARHNVGPVLAEAGAFKRREEHQQFFLLPYASKHWIQHTAHLDDLPLLPEWYHLLDHPTFGIKLADVSVQQTMRSGEHSPTASSQMIWALQNGHILLLKHELVAPRGIRKIQAHVALWRNLRNIKPLTIKESMDYHLIKWLCPMFLRLRMHHPAKYHFLNRLSVFDDYYAHIIKEAVTIDDAEAIAALLSHDNLTEANLSFISPRLIEIAASYEETRPLEHVMSTGLNSTNIIRIVNSGIPDPVLLRLLYRSIRAGLGLSVLREKEVYIATKLLCSYEVRSTVARGIFRSLIPETATPLGSFRKYFLLNRACLKGDIELATFLLRNSSNPNTGTDIGSCLDATLYGLSRDRLRLVWLLLEFSSKPKLSTVVRAIQLRQWALALYLLSTYAASTRPQEAPHIDQYPFLLDNTFDNLDEIDTLFRFPIPIPGKLVDPTLRKTDFAPLFQLPILKSNYWLNWQFFFVPGFLWEHRWGAIASQEEKAFKQQTHVDMAHEDQALIDTPAEILKEESPYISQCRLQYVLLGADENPWIKITTPNSFSVITEISRRWNWLSVREEWEEPERVWHTQGSNRTPFPVWNESSHLDGLGIWQLPVSTDEMVQIHALVDQRRRRWAQVRSGLADSQWAVRELNKSLFLLQGLPNRCKLFVHDARVPAKYLPRWSTSEHGYMERFGFGFAYMSVRIQWLRTLGLLLSTGSVAYADFPEELLQELGGIFDAPSAVSKQDTTYRHGIIPPALEAAFLGPEFWHYLFRHVHNNSHWLSEVTSWLERADPTIFAWTMGPDAPLSFVRAFQSFLKVGVSTGDMEKLESALEVSRSKLVELM